MFHVLDVMEKLQISACDKFRIWIRVTDKLDPSIKKTRGREVDLNLESVFYASVSYTAHCFCVCVCVFVYSLRPFRV